MDVILTERENVTVNANQATVLARRIRVMVRGCLNIKRINQLHLDGSLVSENIDWYCGKQ